MEITPTNIEAAKDHGYLLGLITNTQVNLAIVKTLMIWYSMKERNQEFTTHSIQAKELAPHKLRWTVFYGINDAIVNGTIQAHNINQMGVSR